MQNAYAEQKGLQKGTIFKLKCPADVTTSVMLIDMLLLQPSLHVTVVVIPSAANMTLATSLFITASHNHSQLGFV